MNSLFFFFSSRRRHTRWNCDWSSDVCSSDLHAARRRLFGVFSECILDFGVRKRGLLDVQLLAQSGKSLRRIGAGGPYRIENPPHGLRRAAGGEREAQVRKRIERMRGGEAKRYAQLLRPPSAPAVGPAPLDRNLGGPLLSPVLEQAGEEHGLVGDDRRNSCQPMKAEVRVR